MSIRHPNDVVRVVEFYGSDHDPGTVFAEAAEWLTANAPAALVGVCLLYDGTDGNYGLQLAHVVGDDG